MPSLLARSVPRPSALANPGVIATLIAGYHQMIQTIVARQFQPRSAAAPSCSWDSPARTLP
jgi:hypothetical protein